MATPQPVVPIGFRLARILPTSRERIFQAWTEAEALKTWFAPSAEYATRVPELDVRVGGRYRVEMEKDGTTHSVAGVYRIVDPPSRLAFTWKWASPAEPAETLVTIELFERGGQTEVVLTHEGFSSGPARDEHNKGWTGCLDRLETFVS